MEENMKIKFEIKYCYLPHAGEEQKFQGKVTFNLPKEENGYVSKLYHGFFGKEKVGYPTGKDAGEYRTVDFFIYGPTFEVLEDNIQKAINNYVQQVSTNVKLVEEMEKKGKEITVNIS
jgi:hypothetical protein